MRSEDIRRHERSFIIVLIFSAKNQIWRSVENIYSNKAIILVTSLKNANMWVFISKLELDEVVELRLNNNYSAFLHGTY